MDAQQASQTAPAPPTCPECDSERLRHGRRPIGYPVGALFVLIGFLAALPTLGFSFILTLFGVFLMVPRTRCRDCGYSERSE